MNQAQAQNLAERVELDLGPDQAKPYQIGNGTWVVILVNRRWYYLWSEADWAQYRITKKSA